MTPEQNKARAREFYEQVLGPHKFERIDEYVTANFVDHDPTPGQPIGPEGVRQTFEMYTQAFPDMSVRVQDMIAEGDRVWTMVQVTGTHQGSFMGIPATGKKVAMNGIDILRIEGDKAAERWGVFDMLTLMQQLGLAPAMG